jgi:hypothetical protein
MITSPGSLLALLLAASPAGTQPRAAPRPAAEMEQLKFLLGKWRCEGKAFVSAAGPEHTFKAAAEAKLDGGGHWQTFTYEEKRSKEHPDLVIHGTWGWDAANKRFVRAAADDHGAWDSATSPGLQGDKLVWTGELSGPLGKVPFRQSFIKADKQWSFAIEVKAADGKWAPWNEVTCRR